MVERAKLEFLSMESIGIKRFFFAATISMCRNKLDDPFMKELKVEGSEDLENGATSCEPVLIFPFCRARNTSVMTYGEVVRNNPR